jgi:hypothetical protein
VGARALCGKSASHNSAAEKASPLRRTEGTMRFLKSPARIALVAVASIALSGCFDLTQSVTIDRHGAGRYQVSIAASGMMGDALKNGKSQIDIGQNKNVVTSTVISNGLVTRTSRIDFHSLSDLSLSAEAMSLTVTGHSFFGLGPAHVVFHRVLKVSTARHAEDVGQAGQAIVAGIFGDHVYSFSVTLPGSIDWIAPVKIDGVAVKPTVTGDFYNGHTITWRMPLATMIEADKIDFAVGFSAYGFFTDAQTGRTHHRTGA